MESHSIEAAGIPMRWEEQGEGHPVVFIHGIPTSPRLWRHVIPELDGIRGLAWEMVGYGASIPQGEGRDISVARQAEYLVAWMDAVGLERAVLVGHDLGGGVAQIVAARHPERVQGLVLTNSIAYDSWPIPSVKAMRALGPVLSRLPDAAFRRLFAGIIHRGHDDAARARESIKEHGRYYAAADGAAAFIRQVRSLDVRDTLAIANQLLTLDIPARLVWGTDDDFQDIGYGYRLAVELDAPLDRIERGKHFVPEDHPQRLAAAVQGLVDEIASH